MTKNALPASHQNPNQIYFKAHYYFLHEKKINLPFLTFSQTWNLFPLNTNLIWFVYGAYIYFDYHWNILDFHLLYLKTFCEGSTLLSLRTGEMRKALERK